MLTELLAPMATCQLAQLILRVPQLSQVGACSIHCIHFHSKVTFHSITGVGGGSAGAATAPPKRLIWWKSGQNLWKFGQNLWKRSQNRCMCFDFTEMAPKIKVQDIFLEVMFLFSSFRAS